MTNLTSLQAFFVIFSSICGHICVGSIYILNSYISYFVSYIRFRGSKTNMTHFDGKILMFLIIATYGLSGYPAGKLTSSVPISTSLLAGTGLFMISYMFIFVGGHYVYGILVAAVIGLGIASMMIGISILFGCLRHFNESRGIISGVLFASANISPAILNYWELSFINPKNVSPVQLKGYFETQEEYYDATDVLDRSADFFWILYGAVFIMLMLPVIAFRLYPPPAFEDDDDINFQDSECFTTVCSLCFDVKFVLVIISFGFAGCAGLAARSTLKTYGETFINDENYLSRVGGSGALSSAVGALALGIVLDLHQRGASVLVLLQTVLTFVGTVMMMYASNWGKVWYLLSYDISLFALGGSSAVLALVLLQTFGLTKFPVLYGISFLIQFFSALWYTLSLWNTFPWRDFWLANTLFGFMSVIGAIGFIIKNDIEGKLVDDQEEVFHRYNINPNKYSRFQ